MNTIYTLQFNNKFSIIEKDGKFILLRTYLDEDGNPFEIEFDIKNDYARITIDEKTRYITNTVKRKIENEIQAHEPGLYSKIYQGIIEPEPKQQPKQQPQDGGTGMTEVSNQLASQLLEMQKTMTAGFQAMMSKNPYEDAIISAIIEKGKNISVESLEQEMRGKLDDFIREEYGALPKTIQIQDGDFQKKAVTGIFHKKFDTILKVVSRNVPLMLVGPAGSGKNHTLEQVAEALELDFYFTNAITQEYTLKGFIDANGNFHETEFYKAFTQGGIFFLDEIDASIPEALIVLNAAIANRYFDFPNGRVTAHEDFRVVAAANTVGMGASAEYVGRNQLDAATLDRFVQITFDYDSEVETQLAYSPEMYEFIIDLRNAIAKNDVRYIVSMRATINAAKLADLLSNEELIDTVILKGMEIEDRRILINDLKDNQYSRTLKAMCK